MAESKKIEVIYAELDVLLDTRLGTVAKIDPVIAERILTQEYIVRQNDIFEGVDPVLYKEMYAKRDVDTLALSMATNALQFLRHFVRALSEQAVTRPYHDGSRLVVNCFPYILDEEEKIQITAAIQEWLQQIAPVELVYITPKQLSPKYCKDSYSTMFVYEYEEWLNIHSEEFKTTRIPEITMYVPAIYFGQTPTKEELEKLIAEADHPMQAIEFLVSPLVCLKLIDVKYFSILSKM